MTIILQLGILLGILVSLYFNLQTLRTLRTLVKRQGEELREIKQHNLRMELYRREQRRPQ